ncbi:MAG TPA: GNAT family N-acetyltransferase [Sphingobacteriaceae bacterium]
MQGSLKPITSNVRLRKSVLNVDPILKELTSSDEMIINSIHELLKKHYDTEISSYAIYKDPNYLYFFKTLISNVLDHIFYCVDSDTQAFLGFAHFKEKNNSLYLNNIIVDSEYQSSHVGSFLLFNSLKQLTSDNDYSYFELDVFEKNTRAFNWYIRLGMDIVDYSNWYNITSYFRSDNKGFASPGGYDRESFTCVYDQNGFKQLMQNGLQIGTLINETHLIIKTEIDYNLWRKIHWYFKESSLKSVCLVSKKKHDLFLIDKSFHLRIPFKKLQVT